MIKVAVMYSATRKEWDAHFQRPAMENSIILFSEPRKIDAVDGAVKIGRVVKAELYIHGKNGRIQDRRSYGNDPRGNG